MMTGLVTANIEPYAITDSVSEIRDDGCKYQHESLRIISYGVALMLSGIADWLNALIPRYSGRE